MPTTRINAALAALAATGFSFAFVVMTMPISSLIALGTAA